MSHVFVSYVHRNSRVVQRLLDALAERGIKVWLDQNEIEPGVRWKQAIRKAIREGAFFIACFSKEYNARDKTYMNEELILAIDMLRRLPTDRAWFIPVKLNECEMPDLDIGAGATLRDIQWVDLYKDWDVGVQRILDVIQPGLELVLQEVAAVTDLSKLAGILVRLPDGENGILRETSYLRQWADQVSRLQARFNTIERAVFRKPIAERICSEIESLLQWTDQFHQSLARDFRAVAAHWLEIAQRQLEVVNAVLSEVTTPQVFRAGDPVDRNNEAFVPRNNVIRQLQQQILLDTGCPGIILYGRRRMGKSTILKNLIGFLPMNVVPVAISLQNPEAFISIESFVSYLTQEVQSELGYENSIDVEPTDLSAFFRFLTNCDDQLQAEDKRLLLALDEYEMIDKKIGENIFSEDLLAAIRESIQTHRRLTWVFAGSHEITELSHAPWTSYLISARTVEVPAFTLDETRLLLTEPLRHSSLWSEDSSERLRFKPDFWGDGGIERIHEEAGGWPHLVQLIAETVVDLLNEEEMYQVGADLLTRALDEAIVRGHSVFYELMHRESSLPGEWEYISGFRRRKMQTPPDDEKLYTSLRRRQLIEEEGAEWRLHVPLMTRWLRKRG